MAGAYSPLLREQRNQFVMNAALIALALVGGMAVTNERGLFVPAGIHNAISATAQAFSAIATPAGLRRLMTNSSGFALPHGQTATPLGRLTVASAVPPAPDAEAETMAWMPQEGSAADTAEQLAGADFPTVTNGELLAANTPESTDGGAGSGGGGGGGGASDAPTAAPQVSTYSPPPAPGISIVPPVRVATNDPIIVCPSARIVTDAATGAIICLPVANGSNPVVTDTKPPAVDGAVPEPSAWAMLIGGFALLGLAQRASSARRREREGC